jgi:FHS family glucose/mannose:H+ symporter-like MFS transporter
MAMAANDPTAHPSLRCRFPLYPSQFLGAMAMVSLGPLLDPMMRDLHVPLSRGGLISAGFFLGSVFGIIILNTSMAKVPVKWGLLGGVALQGAGLVAAGAASWDLWSLSLAYLLVGCGGAILNAIGWMWLPAHIKKDVAASALFMILFFGLGMVITPVILGPALDAGASWRWILVAEGGISLALALAFIALPLLDVPGRQNVRSAHFGEVVAHNRGLLLGMAGACFMSTGAETLFNVWLPKFQINVFGAGDTWASLAVTLFWVGMVVGRLIVMPLTRRFAPSRLLLVCACTLAVFAVAVAFAPAQAASLGLSVGAGLGASASYALIGSYCARFPGWQSGVASSVFILSGGLGSMVLPYVFGPIASAAGFRIAMATAAAPALAYAGFSLLIHARARV